MTIIVTGSSGTVGTALCLELVRKGIRVVPVDKRQNIWSKGIDRKTVRMDLRRPISKAKLPARADMIIHLAANARVHELVVKPNRALDNYLMMHHVLEFARLNKIPRLIFSSSREIYGESSKQRPRDESDTAVASIKSPYTASKFGAEAMIHAYINCYDLRAVIVRLSNVYGMYDVSERVIPLFFYNAMRHRDIVVFGKEKKLDFTYINDCIDGICRVVSRFDRVAGETFNLSSGSGERILDLATFVIAATGSASKVRIGEKRTGEISSFVGNIENARTKLAYAPKSTLRNGIDAAWNWYCHVIKNPRIAAEQRRALKPWGWA